MAGSAPNMFVPRRSESHLGWLTMGTQLEIGSAECNDAEKLNKVRSCDAALAWRSYTPQGSRGAEQSETICILWTKKRVPIKAWASAAAFSTTYNGLSAYNTGAYLFPLMKEA